MLSPSRTDRRRALYFALQGEGRSPKRSEGSQVGVSCFVLCLLTMLSACSDLYYDRRETIALSADDHLNANRVEQMVDPWPYYVGDKNLAFNGQRMQDAVERYRHDCVFPPVNPTTTASYITQQQQQMAMQQQTRCQNQANAPAPPPPPPIPAK